MVTEKTGKELVLTKEVYKEIFMEYYKPLSLFAKKVLAGQDEGEDLVHNVFLAIWEKRMSFTDKQHLQAYLYRSVYNQSLTCLKQKRFTTRLQDRMGEDQTDDFNYLSQRVETEMFMEILNAIEQLPAQRKQVFKLSYMEGLKIAEVAEKLHIAEETVRSQRLKARPAAILCNIITYMENTARILAPVTHSTSDCEQHPSPISASMNCVILLHNSHNRDNQK